MLASKKLSGLILVCLPGLTMLSIGGCPPGNGAANQRPIANAGADQSADAGENVTLNGTASDDSDGDDLTFAWVQTGGTAVTLSGANTSLATFIAPDDDTTLTFELTVSDGDLDDTDSVQVSVTADEPPPPGNEDPVADAGTDQSVEGGSAVTLDGSNSSDADGDDFTFSWTQSGGTAVTLTGDDTDSPTFTAPDDDSTLTFELTVDDGNGGTDTDSVVVNVAEVVVPRLFIANFTGDGVLSYANPAGVNGNIAPDTNLAGAQTLLSDPADIVVNAEGALIAANFTGNSITSYENAAEANGNLEPDGNVTGAATLLDDPVSIAANTDEDLLFVADIATDDILVFASTTSNAFNGNLAPTRTIASADINNPFGINFGGNDELYIANNGANNVVVFANASNLNGTVSATRIITSTEFDSLFDVYVSDEDVMYVVDTADGEIYIFNEASSLNGAVTPDLTLDVLPAIAGSLTAIAVDSNGTGYIVDFLASAIYSYDDIASLNGAFNPDRTIQGAATQLNGPIRVFLTE